MKKLIVVTLCLFTATFGRGQWNPGAPVSGATTSGGITNLTATATQGAIWNTQKLNFNNCWDLFFAARVTDAGGLSDGDGFCVVFKQDSSTTIVGGPGGNLGYYNNTAVFDSSFGIEFDNFNNTPGATTVNPWWSEPVPWMEHVIIQHNGMPNVANNLAPAQAWHPFITDIGNDSAYCYHISWNSFTNTLIVNVDGSDRIIHNFDYRTIFSDPTFVTMGFTGGNQSAASNYIVANVHLEENVCNEFPNCFNEDGSTTPVDEGNFWRVTGNSITGGNNIFGTLTNDDVLIQTNSTDRGIFTLDGMLGWHTTTPTAYLHVDCSGNNPSGVRPTDIRFEKLEEGKGTIMVIDGDGYVADSKIDPVSYLLGCTTPNFVPKSTGSGVTCSQIFDNGTSVGINTVGPFGYTWSGGLSGPAAPPPTGIVRLDVRGVTRSLAYIATSDAKFKEQVSDINDPFSIINKLQGKTYYWNAAAKQDMGADDSRQYGFIAQDVKEVMPEAVIIDEEGNHGVAYNAFIPLLTEGQKELYKLYQEQKTLNNQLVQELDAVKAKVQELLNCCPAGANSLQDANNGNILYQNAPNPFGTETSIAYDIRVMQQNAFILILDLNGRELSRHAINTKGKGEIKINGTEMVPGIYLYSLIVDGKEEATRRMVLSM